MEDIRKRYRELPKVDDLLKEEALILLAGETSHQAVTDTIREVLGQIREEIADGRRREAVTVPEVLSLVCRKVRNAEKGSLRRVVNATGIILHTNLGRARLSPRAIAAVTETASCCTNLEYDISRGTRGLRHRHIEDILRKVTGAEAAMVVNNNAAATMLCLAVLAKGREVVVSRGELVEIGGSFRIPDIMEESGAVLKEIGTTNKTKLSDYRTAYDADRTAAFLKVHTSNYRVVGFTQEVSVNELAKLGAKCRVPVVYDLGSGLIHDLEPYGLDEPSVEQALAQGADVVLFSGDKLLGGPQAGIILGKKEYIDRMKAHPLARVLRVDKMTIAALCATFYEYLDREQARRRIPVLRMLTEEPQVLKARAKELQRQLLEAWRESDAETEAAEAAEAEVPTVTVEACEDQVGGGSAPTVVLEGYAVTVTCGNEKPECMEQRLRQAEIPVIARIMKDRLWFSVRTLQEEEIPLVVKALMQDERG